MRRRIAIPIAALCALLGTGAAAAEEAAELDEEFLEFLASLDGDDEILDGFLDAAESDKTADEDRKADPKKDEQVKGEDKGEGDDQP